MPGATLSQCGELDDAAGERCCVFLCHAGEEKRTFVVLLKEALEEWDPHAVVFMDEHSLEAGHAAQQAIFEHLGDASVVVLVLSKAFITKPYPMEELHLIMERERSGRGTAARIVPVWYDVNSGILKEQQRRYASLADTLKELVASEAPLDPGLVEILAPFASHAQTLGGFYSLFCQYSEDLRQIMQVTAVRYDQAHDITQLRDLVAQAACRFLRQPKTVAGIMDLPDPFVFDAQRVDALIQHLLSRPPLHAAILSDLAGMGKSVLAKAAVMQLLVLFPDTSSCYLDLQNKAHLSDADVTHIQHSAIKQLTPDSHDRPGTAADGRATLARLLRNRKLVMLVDNAHPATLDLVLPWGPQVFQGPYRAGDQREGAGLLHWLDAESTVLITTRAESMASDSVFHKHNKCTSLPMTGMDDGMAKQLILAYGLGAVDEPSGPEEVALQALLAECAGCPVALEAAGRYLGEELLGWDEVANNGAHCFLAEALKHSTEKLHGGLLSSYGMSASAAVAHQAVDSIARLRDIAFYVKRAEEDKEGQPAQLYLWALQERERAALARLGVVAQRTGVSSQLHKVLADISQVVWLDRDKLQVKREGTALLDEWQGDAEAVKELLTKLEGFWLYDDGPLDPCCLLSSCGDGLRLLQLACSLQQPQLRVPKSASLYLVGVGAAFGDKLAAHSAGGSLTVNLRESIRPEAWAPVVVLHGWQELQTLDFAAAKHVHALMVAECERLESLQLAKLVNLKKLTIRGCPQLQCVQGLGKLRAVTELCLCGCSLSMVAPAEAGERLASFRTLKRLIVEPCSCCQPTLCLQTMALSTSGSSIRLRDLTRLTHLELSSHCCQQQVPPAQPDTQLLPDQDNNVHQHTLRGSCLSGIPAGSLLSSLTGLQVAPVGLELQHIGGPGLGRLLLQKTQPNNRRLGHLLQLSDCQALQELHVSPVLAEVQLDNCMHLKSLRLPPAPAPGCCLRKLVLHRCPQLALLPDLSVATALTALELRHCPLVASITLGSSVQEVLLEACDELAQLWLAAITAAARTPAIRCLRLLSCRQLAVLPDLHLLPSLALLQVRGCDSIQELQLGPSLLHVCVSGCASLVQLQASAARVADQQAPAFQLRVLRVDACPNMFHISGIPLLKQLVELDITNCAALQGLELSRSLRNVTVEACSQLTSIQCLAMSTDASAAAVAASWQPERLDLLTRVVVAECELLEPAPCSEHLLHPRRCRYLFDGQQQSWECRRLDTCCMFHARSHAVALPACPTPESDGDVLSALYSSLFSLPHSASLLCPPAAPTCSNTSRSLALT